MIRLRWCFAEVLAQEGCLAESRGVLREAEDIVQWEPVQVRIPSFIVR